MRERERDGGRERESECDTMMRSIWGKLPLEQWTVE